VGQFRWGILGSGAVATKFALGLRTARDARVVSVASRTRGHAERFARTLDIPRWFDSYEEAVESGGVDAFYVATPPSVHYAHARLCLEARVPVLVEKPFTLDGVQARQLRQLAGSTGVFCMEALWTRFLPLVRELKQQVDTGRLGQVRVLTGSFGVAEAPGSSQSLYDPSTGGGSLLHRGVYPISLAYHLLGPPEDVHADLKLGETGVDEQCSLVLRYRSGAHALLYSSLRATAPNDLTVLGSRANVHVLPPIYRPFRMTFEDVKERRGPAQDAPGRSGLRDSAWAQALQQRLIPWATSLRRLVSSRSIPYSGNGYHYQADEVASCIAAGKLESEIMPLSQSVEIMELIDRIRLGRAQALGAVAEPPSGQTT